MNSIEPSHPRERWLFLGSGALLLVAVLFGLAREQRWGTRFVNVYLLASDISGLHSGEEVRISGFPVGQVGGLELKPDARVRVQLRIEQSKARLIGPNSSARLAQEGLVGDRFIDISPDPQRVGDAQALDGKTIAYAEPLNLADALEDLAVTQQQLQATLRNTTSLTAKNGDINTTLADLRNTLKNTNTLTATIEREAAETAPVVRRSLDNVSAEISQVSQEARVAEKEAQLLLQESRPLITSTLQDVRELAQTSRRLLNSLLGVLGPWLEPADGRNSATPATDSNAQHP
jgi:phospholipid/cholesterol/gamma-HCH transport system substrate-binding protein